jgi:hypothetical protein
MNMLPEKTRSAALIWAVIVLAGFTAANGQDAEPVVESLSRAVPYTSESLRDPFEGYIQKKVEAIPASRLAEEENFVPPPLAISGITWGSSFPQAIVNGKVVKAGDMVGDVGVVSISKEGLVFLYNNQQFSMPAPGVSGAQKSGQDTP